MDFGYFNLFDNQYEGNPRTANEAVYQAYEQAIWADRIGMHGVWLGERHFNLLSVQGNPNMLLAALARNTTNIRLCSSVNVLPFHHPLRLAEEIATIDLLSGGRVNFGCGRGTVKKEFAGFDANWNENAEVFDECLDILLKAWSEPGPWSYNGKHFQIPEVQVVPKPVQNPPPVFIGSTWVRSMELTVKRNLNLMLASIGAQRYGGLDKAIAKYRELCAKHQRVPQRVVASWFIHITDTAEEERKARTMIMKYLRESFVGSEVIPTTTEGTPADMHHNIKFMESVSALNEDTLSERQILLGSPARIIELLKKAEEWGLDEVMLYFSYGLKPHELVKEQMQRVMEEIAPHFDGFHKRVGEKPSI